MRRYQDIAHDLYRHVHGLTKDGVFNKHQAARTIMLFFATNISNKDDKDNGLRPGFVMEGCLNQTVIGNNTGLGKSAVSEGMNWLHDQGLIKMLQRFDGEGTKRLRTVSVEITSFDAESEAERKAWLKRKASPDGQPILPEIPDAEDGQSSVSLSETTQTGADHGQDDDPVSLRETTDSLRETPVSLSGQITKETPTKETLQRDEPSQGTLSPGPQPGGTASPWTPAELPGPVATGSDTSGEQSPGLTATSAPGTPATRPAGPRPELRAVPEVPSDWYVSTDGRQYRRPGPDAVAWAANEVVYHGTQDDLLEEYPNATYSRSAPRPAADAATVAVASSIARREAFADEQVEGGR